MCNNLQLNERTAMSLVRYYRELDVSLVVRMAEQPEKWLIKPKGE